MTLASCYALATYFFFFFQAEDGIRDLTVTGVQTCALPIYSCGEWAKRSWPTGFRVRAFPSFLRWRSEEHTSELQSQSNLVCRLLLEKKKQMDDTLERLLLARGAELRGARCHAGADTGLRSS